MNKSFFSPLEQFDTMVLKFFVKDSPNQFYFTYLDYSFLNMVLPLLIVNVLLFAILFFFKSNICLLPVSNLQMMFEKMFKFVNSIIFQQMGFDGFLYFPLMFNLFFFILFCNLLSLIPFGLAMTSHMMMMFFMSSTMCLSMFWMGNMNYSFHFLKIFVPECPAWLLPILMPIEIFSYFMSMFSLAMSLAANILAGHTLVNIMSSSLLKVSSAKLWLYFILVIPLFAMLLLEFGVAFLQAYVFTMLLCMYFSDAVNGPSH